MDDREYFSCVGKRTRAKTDQFVERKYLELKGLSKDEVSQRPQKSKGGKKVEVEEKSASKVSSSRLPSRIKKKKGGSVSNRSVQGPDFEFIGIQENGIMRYADGSSSSFGAGTSRVNEPPKFVFGDTDEDDDVEVIEVMEESDENVVNVSDEDDSDLSGVGLKHRVRSKSVLDSKRFGRKGQESKDSGFGKSGSLKTWDSFFNDKFHKFGGFDFDARGAEKKDLDDDDGFGKKGPKVKISAFGKSGLKRRVQAESVSDDESDHDHHCDFFEETAEVERIFGASSQGGTCMGGDKDDDDGLENNSESSHDNSISSSGNLFSSGDTNDDVPDDDDEEEEEDDDDDDDDSEDKDFQVGMSDSSESLVKSSSYEEEGDEEDSSNKSDHAEDERVGREGKEESVESEKRKTKIPQELDRKSGEDDHNNGANDCDSDNKSEIKRMAPKITSTEMGKQRDKSSKKGKSLNFQSGDDDDDQDGRLNDFDDNGAKGETNDAFNSNFADGVAFGEKEVEAEQRKSGKFDARKGSCKTQKKLVKKSQKDDHNKGDNGGGLGVTERSCAGEIKRTTTKSTSTEMGNGRDRSSKKSKRLNMPSVDDGDNDENGVKNSSNGEFKKETSSDMGSRRDGSVKKQNSINVPSGDDVDNAENGVKKSDDNGAKGESNDEFNDNFADRVTSGEEEVGLEERKVGEIDAKNLTGELKSSNACQVLLNAIFAKGEEIGKRLVTSEEKAQEIPPAAEQTLPLKFYFGVDEPEPVEKSDFDLQMDSMWSELQVALEFNEIGSFAPHVVDTEEADDSGTEDLCSKGNHHFTLNEEIGIQCIRCSLVKVEIKYNMPPLVEKISSGISGKKSSLGEQDLDIPDGLNFKKTGGEAGGSCSHVEGTVWDIIPGLKKSMYQHQQEGFEFIWKNLEGTLNLEQLKVSDSNDVGGCIISHAPGTGKTRLTIVFLQTYLELFPNSKPVIIAPASMLLTWEEEFRKWGVAIPFHNLNNLEPSGSENFADVNISDMNGKRGGTKDLIRLVKLFLWSKHKSILGISYSLYEKLVGEKPKVDKDNKKGMKKQKKETEELRRVLLEFPGLLVLDEGHTPRNQRSRIWKALTQVETKRRIILSGTPFQNNFSELYNILCLVRPAFANLIPSDLKKFCQKKSMRRKVAVGQKSASTDRFAAVAIEELKGMIQPFVHVHKGSILQESLPGLKDCVIVLNPASDLQKRIIDNIECSKNTFEFEHQLALSTVHPSLMLQVSHSKKEESVIDRALLERLRLNPNEGSKTRFLMELVRLSVALKEKVLVFSQFIQPLCLIKEQLCSIFNWKEGKELLQMQGRLDQERRQLLINGFNDPKSEAKILLASTKACSEGINLVGASRVVLLDVVWNPSVERQAISRAYRLGQTKMVYTYHLIMLGTAEWEKYCKQAEKDRLSELVFSSSHKENEKQKTSPELSADEILNEMISHDKLKGIFERIIYQPKESKLIETFT